MHVICVRKMLQLRIKQYKDSRNQILQKWTSSRELDFKNSQKNFQLLIHKDNFAKQLLH